MRDWSKAGHIMRQVGGKVTVTSKNDLNQEPITKITHKLVTEENRNGDTNFKRYAWTIPSLPRTVLIQFIGDEKLSKPIIHGNAKSAQARPRLNILPSIAETVRNSKDTPAIIYENLRLSAGNTALEQRLFSPHSKSQIKNLRRYDKFTQGHSDAISILLRISQEYKDVKFMMVNPRLMLVQIDDEMSNYARNLLELGWEEGGCLQLIGYDTQFRIGDFYASALTIREPRLRHKGSNAVITIPLFLVIHQRKLQDDHDLAFRFMIKEVPQLASKFFIACSDNEFTKTMERHFKKAFVAVDEVHETKAIVR